jgi:hypothetical protein
VLVHRLSDDDIYERYGTDGEDQEENPQNVFDAALDARRWIDGDYDDAADLVTSWKDLVVE